MKIMKVMKNVLMPYNDFMTGLDHFQLLLFVTTFCAMGIRKRLNTGFPAPILYISLMHNSKIYCKLLTNRISFIAYNKGLS